MYGKTVERTREVGRGRAACPRDEPDEILQAARLELPVARHVARCFPHAVGLLCSERRLREVEVVRVPFIALVAFVRCRARQPRAQRRVRHRRRRGEHRRRAVAERVDRVEPRGLDAVAVAVGGDGVRGRCKAVVVRRQVELVGGGVPAISRASFGCHRLAVADGLVLCVMHPRGGGRGRRCAVIATWRVGEYVVARPRPC